MHIVCPIIALVIRAELPPIRSLAWLCRKDRAGSGGRLLNAQSAATHFAVLFAVLPSSMLIA